MRARRLQVADAVAWTGAILGTAGVESDAARTAAEMMVRTEARGVRTHGLTRLASYLEKMQAGEVNPAARITVRKQAGVCTVDADGALGQVAAARAVDEGMSLLQDAPSVICRIRNCGHLGALGIYALVAAEHGYLALVFQRTPPLMGLAGFGGPALGNNPMGFGCPIPGPGPLVFDMACSVAARGHVLVAAREQRPIPDGWALDAQGRPTTSAEAALHGSLMPMAGHKGLGLAMMAECLAGALAGGDVESLRSGQSVPRSGAAGGQSTLIWLVNPALTTGSAFDAYLQAWTGSFKAHAGPGGRLPGERASALEAQANREGLELSGSLAAELDDIGAARQLAVPWTQGH